MSSTAAESTITGRNYDDIEGSSPNVTIRLSTLVSSGVDPNVSLSWNMGARTGWAAMYTSRQGQIRNSDENATTGLVLPLMEVTCQTDNESGLWTGRHADASENAGASGVIEFNVRKLKQVPIAALDEAAQHVRTKRYTG